jgi:hypothetical protein
MRLDVCDNRSIEAISAPAADGRVTARPRDNPHSRHRMPRGRPAGCAESRSRRESAHSPVSPGNPEAPESADGLAPYSTDSIDSEYFPN